MDLWIALFSWIVLGVIVSDTLRKEWARGTPRWKPKSVRASLANSVVALTGLALCTTALRMALFTLDIMVVTPVPTWPTADGIVKSSKVAGTREDGYRPLIYYEYSVEGKVHISHSLRPGRGTPLYSLRSAENWVNGNQKGTKVKVYYHPRDPSVAALDPQGSHGMSTMPFIGMLGLILVFLAVLFGGGLMSLAIAVVLRAVLLLAGF